MASISGETIPTGPRESLFDGLPAELVCYIFTLAANHYMLDIRDAKSPNGSWQRPQTYLSTITVLAGVQTSSRIRALLLKHQPYWHVVAEMALLIGPDGGPGQSLDLLSLASQCSAQTLRRIDLTDAAEMNRSCLKHTMGLLFRIAPSAASLQELQLPYFPWRSKEPCGCHLCRRLEVRDEAPLTPMTAGAHRLDAVVYDLLSKAIGLRYLSLPIARRHPDGLSMSIARPSTLRLNLRYDGVLTPDGRSFLQSLASAVTRLEVYDSRLDTSSFLGQHSIPLLVHHVCLNLRTLQLSGPPATMGFASLFDYDFPLLQILSINITASALDHWQGASDITASLNAPLLTSLEVQATLLRLFDTPHLQRLAVIGTCRGDEVNLLERLRQMPDLEDLAIHSQDDVFFRKLLEGLTRVGDRNFPCPALSRLCLAGQPLSFHQWLLDYGLAENDRDANTGSMQGSQPYPILFRVPFNASRKPPIVGYEICTLVKERLRLSSLQSSESTDEGLPSTSNRCRALSKVCIYNCDVQPWIKNTLSKLLEDEQGLRFVVNLRRALPPAAEAQAQ